MFNMEKVCLVLLVTIVCAYMSQAASGDWSRADESRDNVQGIKPYGSAESELDELVEPGEEASAQNWIESADSPDQDQSEMSQGSSIDANRVEFSGSDLSPAAGYQHHHHHHHHGGHYGASGKMSMGAYSGHKGAFGWHAKFPAGGKGRR